MNNDNKFCIEVSGPYACFTRPEFKAERVSYEIITPSAAKGILKSIYWKPAIDWVITKIEILKPIKFEFLQRRELKYIGYNQDLIENTLRGSYILKDVAYRIYTTMIYTPQNIIINKKNEIFKKHIAIFKKRISKGSCFCQPFLGCREFSCNFKLIENFNNVNLASPIKESKYLDSMLYDIDYKNNYNPIFFKANMINGTVIIPQINF